jgi:hypothetical protein
MPYTFYAKMLGTEADASGAEEWAWEIVVRFAREDATIKDIARKFPERKDQIPHLKKWLQSKLEKD